MTKEEIKMRRRLCVFLVMCMVVLVVSASSVVAEEVIQVLSPGGGVMRVTQTAVELFNERYEGQYRVEFTTIPTMGEILNRMMLQFISGNATYDVLPNFLDWTKGINMYFYPLNDMMEASGVDRSEYLPLLGDFTLEGQVVSIPFRFGCDIFVYRKDLFEEAGLPFIVGDSSMYDVKEAARKLTRDIDGDGKNDVYGLFQHMNDPTRTWVELNTYYTIPGGDWLTSDFKKANPLLKSDYAGEKFEFMRSFWKEGLCLDPIGQSTVELWEMIQTGKAAMADSVYSAFGLHFEEPGSNSKGKMGYSAIPSYPRGASKPRATQGTWAYGIDKNSEHVKAAFEFVKFTNSFEAQFVMAIKGGNGPVRWDVFEHPEYRALNPVLPAIREAFLTRTVIPQRPNVPQSQEIVAAAMEDVHKFMLGEASGRSLGEALYNRINTILEAGE